MQIYAAGASKSDLWETDLEEKNPVFHSLRLISRSLVYLFNQEEKRTHQINLRSVTPEKTILVKKQKPSDDRMGWKQTKQSIIIINWIYPLT